MPQYLSTDPNAGVQKPPQYLSMDPNAGGQGSFEEGTAGVGSSIPARILSEGVPAFVGGLGRGAMGLAQFGAGIGMTPVNAALGRPNAASESADASVANLQGAGAELGQGNILSAFAKAGGAVPVAGPGALDLGERTAQTGDYFGAAGELAAPLVVGGIARGVGPSIPPGLARLRAFGKDIAPDVGTLLKDKFTTPIGVGATVTGITGNPVLGAAAGFGTRFIQNRMARKAKAAADVEKIQARDLKDQLKVEDQFAKAQGKEAAAVEAPAKPSSLSPAIQKQVADFKKVMAPVLEKVKIEARTGRGEPFQTRVRHVTTPENAVSIRKTGFDPNRKGGLGGDDYGPGVYLADEASDAGSFWREQLATKNESGIVPTEAMGGTVELKNALRVEDIGKSISGPGGRYTGMFSPLGPRGIIEKYLPKELGEFDKGVKSGVTPNRMLGSIVKDLGYDGLVIDRMKGQEIISFRADSVTFDSFRSPKSQPPRAAPVDVVKLVERIGPEFTAEQTAAQIQKQMKFPADQLPEIIQVVKLARQKLGMKPPKPVVEPDLLGQLQASLKR